jgi:hypothetical protein
MLDTGNTNAASGGIWQSSRNPEPAAACGLSVALVLDVSGSVANSLVALRPPADLHQLARRRARRSRSSPSPPRSGQHHEQPEPSGPRLDPDQADTVTADDGLTRAARTGTAASSRWPGGTRLTSYRHHRRQSDGLRQRPGPGNFTLRELENGIFSANTVKAKAAG